MTQDYSGRAKYRTDVRDPTGNLIVAVLCRVGDGRGEELALLDTAGYWCVLPPSDAQALGIDVPSNGDTLLDSRFGLLAGELIRLSVTFVVEEGEPTEVDATWFVSPDWPGPMVIGWKGCLERMRFAFDPQENDFYSAEY